jgi:hypothetical protein
MNAWSFVTLVLAALALGAPLAHVLEMPVRRTYDPALYVTVTHTLYRYFGIVGAMFEVGAVVAAVIWAAGLGRSRAAPRSARRWAVAGAACLALAHVLFWLLVYPVNQEFAAWTPAAVPPDWTRLRDQWEFTHAARAGLFLLGFCALLASMLGARCPPGPVSPGLRRRGETTG